MTAGRSGLPGIDDIDEDEFGEFGTRSGVHVLVNMSSDSPDGHAATVGAGFSERANAATAGAVKAANANPPASTSRDAVILCVAICHIPLVC